MCLCVSQCITRRHRQQYDDSHKERRVEEVEVGKQGINGDRKMTLGGELMMQYEQDVLLSCTLNSVWFY